MSILIPFKDYKFSVGILDSQWVGLKNFKWMLTATSMQRVVRNTVLYGIWFLIIGPIVNVIFALLLFEVKSRKRLKFYQTVITFPNFMSMVIVGYVAYAVLSPQAGIMNSFLKFLGKDPVDVYMNSTWWPLILTIVNLWKGVGMGSMMYFAALMGIDTKLYEAAELDGATRFQKMRYISLPQLVPLVCIFSILGAGSLVSGNFDLFYIIPRNTTILYETTDILNTYVYGKRWMKQHMNQESGICMRTDAFGNSAQLPQIVRGFGCKYIGRICYSTCDGNYWRGLDGSTVVTKPFQIVFESGGYYKYRPCPKCKGYGCKACRYRGIDEVYIQRQIIPMSRMDTGKVTGDPLEYILCGGEELMPRRDILTFREEHKDDLEVVFSSYEDLYREIDLSRVDNPPEEEVASSVEMNTNNTGTYATRIRMKQRLRNCESALFTAENLESQYALATGKAHTEKLEAIWRQVNFTMFHDAVPATHVDAAYAELMDTFDWIEEEVHALNDENKQLFVQPKEQVLTVYNPSANAVERELLLDGDDWTADEEKLILANGRYLVKLAAYEALELHCAKKKRDVETQKLGRQILSEGTSILTDVEIKTQAVEELDEVVIENGRYRITAGLHGIREIFDKKLGYAIAKEEEYCPFGFLLEHDDGSPWATMSSDLRRTSLKKDTILETIEHGEGYDRLKFKIALPDRVIAYSVTGVDISYDVTLYHDSDKIYMNCRVFWDTINHRLRIAMPLTITGQDVYEIPYGWLERKEYGLARFREGSENWAGSINDYPAMNWAGVQAEQCGVFLFNQGTPSHYITSNQNGGRTIFLTPLRSPNNATYLHDPAAYSMTDWDGMRDAGTHEFSYMLESFAGNRTQKYAVLAGAGFAATPLVTEGEFQPLELPVLTGDSARISSIKRAEDDDALIVRMVEIGGEKTQIAMRVPDWAASAERTDLNEHTTDDLEIVNGRIRLQFHPFEIKTVKLKIKR